MRPFTLGNTLCSLVYQTPKCPFHNVITTFHTVPLVRRCPHVRPDVPVLFSHVPASAANIRASYLTYGVAMALVALYTGVFPV